MSYCNTKAQEKARYKAIEEVKSGRSKAQVARRFGRNRSTIYRWIKRYESLIKNHEIIGIYQLLALSQRIVLEA